MKKCHWKLLKEWLLDQIETQFAICSHKVLQDSKFESFKDHFIRKVCQLLKWQFIAAKHLHRNLILIQAFVVGASSIDCLGGSSGLVVMEGDSCTRGREFKSQQPNGLFFTFCCKIVLMSKKQQISDGSIPHLFVVKLYWMLEKTKNKWKRSWGWPIIKKSTT